VVGDLVPEPVSPLGWSLVWQPCGATGFRDTLVRRFGFDDEDFTAGAPETIARIDGRAFINATALRIWAQRVPQLGLDHIDPLLTNGPTALPAHEPRPWHEADPVTTGMLDQWYRWVLTSRNQTELHESHRRTSLAVRQPIDLGSLTDTQLFERVRELQPLCRNLFDQHLQQTLAATVGPAVVAAVCRRVGQPASALRLLSGIGGVDTIGPGQALWQLSRLVRRSGPLVELFDAGADGLGRGLAASPEPDAVALVAGVETLLAEAGYRGRSEWDLASRTWDEVPDVVLSMLDLLRRRGDDHDPEAGRARLAAHRVRLATEIADSLPEPDRAEFLAGLASSMVFLRGREQSRTDAVRIIHAMRLALRELAARAHTRGDLDDADNLWEYPSAQVASYAAGERDALVERPQRSHEFPSPGESPSCMVAGSDGWTVGSAIAAPHDLGGEPFRSGDVMLGAPAGPGLVSGPARIVLDAADIGRIGDEDVVILAQADLAAAPLFLAGRAVVAQTGHSFSPGAVAARELGVPVVVGVAEATRRIPDGAVVNVDGLTGVVSLA
jgi:pyruvate,water dikinase